VALSTKELLELVAALPGEQQAAVEKFVRILKEQESPHEFAFRAALSEFVRRHPDLLRLLA